MSYFAYATITSKGKGSNEMNYMKFIFLVLITIGLVTNRVIFSFFTVDFS